MKSASDVWVLLAFAVVDVCVFKVQSRSDWVLHAWRENELNWFGLEAGGQGMSRFSSLLGQELVRSASISAKIASI